MIHIESMFNQKTLSVLFIGKNGPLRKYLVFPSRNSHFSSRNSRTSARSMVYSSLQHFSRLLSTRLNNNLQSSRRFSGKNSDIRKVRNIYSRQFSREHCRPIKLVITNIIIRKYYYAHQTMLLIF